MAITHGRHVDVFLNEFDLTSFCNSMDISREIDTPESTVFGNDDRTYIAGLHGSTVNIGGFWDNTATLGADVILRSTLGVATIRTVTIGPEGTAVGDVVYLFTTHSTAYNITGAVDGIVEFTADLQASSEVQGGFSLHALTVETSTDTTNAVSVDQLTTSAGLGAVGHLHVSALDTPTTLDVDIDDDTDDSTYATLVSFTQVTTSLTSERVLVASGTATDRYASCRWTIVGTSYTFSVGYGRR